MNNTERIEQMHTDITQLVIDQIKLGQVTGEWNPPWSAGANIWSPTNPVTGKRYTAGNRFNLSLFAALTPGWGAHFATYKQWASLSQHTPGCVEHRQFDPTDSKKLRRPERALCEQHGCELVHVTSGEHGVMALRPKLRKETGPDGVEREKVIGWIGYTVFNSAQVTNYTEPIPTPVVSADWATDLLSADAYAELIGVELMHSISDGAAYIPIKDYIIMPSHDRWANGDGYWATLIHEMIHWTGHPDRLDRPVARHIVENTDYGRDAYAKEELIAELGAAFHLAHLGRSAVPREDHIKYLEHWLSILEEDPEALWKAAGQAERASLMLGRLYSTAIEQEPTFA